jgi:hypothetical protein
METEPNHVSQSKHPVLQVAFTPLWAGPKTPIPVRQWHTTAGVLNSFQWTDEQSTLLFTIVIYAGSFCGTSRVCE